MTRRIQSAEAMWAALEPLLPLMGITRVGSITGLDIIGIPVVSVYRPDSRSLVVSMGKGMTELEARVSAVMEAAETYCSERITERLIHGTVRDLAGRYNLVNIEGISRVPEIPPENTPIYWIEGMEVDTQMPCWVPYEMVHTRYTPAARPYFPTFVATSRGLAAGATIVEATCHAVLELIEGDANARAYEFTNEEWGPRQLDLSTVDDVDSVYILDRLDEVGIVANVLDSTTMMGIPSFLVAIVDERDDSWRVVPVARGMGCHPSRAIALQRALLEAVQGRAAMISGAREDLYRVMYSRSQDAIIRDMVRSAAKRGVRDWHDIPTREWKSAEDDLAWTLDTLALWGMNQVVVVDVGGDFPFPVIRAIIPWLRAEVLA